MGQRVRDSAHTRNKELACSIERARRKAMEESAGGVKRPKPLLFSKAEKTWLAGNAHWSKSYREINTLKLSHLIPFFGKLLITEISNEKISSFQRKRNVAGASGREINMESGVLRMILRQHGVWHLLAPNFHPMPENEEVGHAIPMDDVNKLLEAAIESRSRSLFPSLMIYLHTGVRAAESHIQWKKVDFDKRTITVGHSKTKGEEGRVIPLNDEAFEILVEWHSRFKDVKPDHYLFPSERYGFKGYQSYLTGAVAIYDLDPTKPMASMKTAWTACRKAAGVWCRLHDFRHTFISALGAAGVPDSTIKALAGWMPAKMLGRYSHTANQAKREAVDKLPKYSPSSTTP
jgi:integrase